MPVREIKTTLTLDGEKEFDQEISSAARNLRVMNSELKRASAEYDATGDRTAYLTSKSETLKNQIAQQKEIFQALARAVESSAQSTSDASAKTDGYRIRMNNTAAAIAKMERELADTDREMEEFGRDSIKVGRQIEDGIGESAERAGKSLDEMYEKLQGDIGSLRGSTAISAVVDLGGAVIDTGQALNDFAESSRDYRRQMSFLEQNAEDAGLDFSDVKDLIFEITSLTGEMEGSVEGVSNLLAIGFDTSEMELAMESLAGAVIKFPETMKFENLAESLQESISTGEATGAFAELMDRMGVSTEDFAEAMKAATTEEEKQQVVLSFLNSMALRPTTEAYEKTNEKLIEAEESTQRLNAAWAELGGTVDTWLTPIRDGVTAALTEINRFINEGPTAAQQEAIDRLEDAADMPIVSSTSLMGEMPQSGGWLEGIRAWKQILTGGKEAGKEMGEEISKEMLEATVDAIEAGGTDMGNAAKEATKSAMFKAAETSLDSREELDILNEEILNAFAVGDNRRGWELTAQYDALIAQIVEEEKKAINEIGNVGAEGGALAGEEMIEGMNSALVEGAPAAEENAETIGRNMTTSLADGIAESGKKAIATAADVVNAINATFNQISMPDLSGISSQYYSLPAASAGGGGGNLFRTQVTLNVDSKKVATVITPTVSSLLSSSASRYSALA